MAPCLQRFAYFVSTASTDKRLLLLISAERSAFSLKILQRGRGFALQGVSVGNASSSDGYVGGRFVSAVGWIGMLVV